MLIVALLAVAALALIWFGYPLVMAAIAVFHRPLTTGSAPARRRVSVIIATLDAEEVIRARVADVRAGDYPADCLEVVVALDHASAVAPASLADLGASVRVVRGAPPGGKADALNAGVAAATGSILVFTDAAQRFEREAISRLVGALEDPRLGAVSGALHIGRDGRPANLAEWYWRFERWLRETEARVHSPVGVTGAVYAMKRECWHPLPSGLILDDLYGPMHLVLRGYRIGFDPRARAYDDRRFPPAQEFRRKVRTLTGVLQLCAWLPDVLVPWRNPIWAQFLFHKLLRLASPYLLLAIVVSMGGWGVSVLSGGVARPVLLLAIAATAALAALGLAVPRIRHALLMAAAMQGAIVRATVNGARGRWNVWSR